MLNKIPITKGMDVNHMGIYCEFLDDVTDVEVCQTFPGTYYLSNYN